METFLSRRPVIVDELIRRDGLQEHTSLPQCAICLEELGMYRCIDCTLSTLYCASCIVHKHESTPLHRLEVCRVSSNVPPLPFSRSVSSGIVDSSSVQRSTTWTTGSFLVTSTPLVRRRTQLKPFSLSTTMGFTTSRSNFVDARRVPSGLKNTASYCA